MSYNVHDLGDDHWNSKDLHFTKSENKLENPVFYHSFRWSNHQKCDSYFS